MPDNGIAQVVKILHDATPHPRDDVSLADARLGGRAARLDFPDGHALALVYSPCGGVRPHSQIGLHVLLCPLLIAGLGLDGGANQRQTEKGHRRQERLVHADLL